MRSKKALLNIISGLVLQFLIVINGFIVPKIIISTFGSSVNGLIASITQFLSYITLLEAGIGPVVKSALYKPIASKDMSSISNILKSSEKYFKFIAYIFILYIVVLMVLYPLIVNSSFNNIYTMSLIIIISISTFAEYYFGMTYKLYLQAEQKSYIISIIQILTYVLNMISVIILVKFNASIHIIKLMTGLLFVFRPLLQNLYVKRKYGICLKDAKGDYNFKQRWDGMAQHIAWVIHKSTDVAILTFFGLLEDISVYSVYHMVTNGIESVINVFINSIGSTFGDMIAKKEDDNLKKKFGIYETMYFMMCTILYACVLVLILPFISIYTKGIEDAEYIRHTFSYLIVISSILFSIRSPYNELTKAAGIFKETRNGAIIEAISNIIISLTFVSMYGLIGVAIGTVVAMTIRTIDLIVKANKLVLKRSCLISVKKILFVILELLMIIIVSNHIKIVEYTNYLNWVINALLVAITSTIIVLGLGFIFYRKELEDVGQIIKNLLKRKLKRS